MAFKVVTIGADGSRDEDDEVFATHDEADEHGMELVGNFRVGAEVLHMHNPGDYPDPDEQIDYEVIEVDDSAL